MHGKDSTGIDRADPLFGYPLESVEIGIADKPPVDTEPTLALWQYKHICYYGQRTKHMEFVNVCAYRLR